MIEPAPGQDNHSPQWQASRWWGHLILGFLVCYKASCTQKWLQRWHADLASLLSNAHSDSIVSGCPWQPGRSWMYSVPSHVYLEPPLGWWPLHNTLRRSKKKFKHFGSLWYKGLNKSYGWCNAAWCIVLYRSCRWSCRLYKCHRHQAQLQTPKCGRSPLSVEKQVVVHKVVVEKTTSCPLYVMLPSLTSHSPSIQTLELSWEHRVPSFTLLARAKKKSYPSAKQYNLQTSWSGRQQHNHRCKKPKRTLLF